MIVCGVEVKHGVLQVVRRSDLASIDPMTGGLSRTGRGLQRHSKPIQRGAEAAARFNRTGSTLRAAGPALYQTINRQKQARQAETALHPAVHPAVHPRHQE